MKASLYSKQKPATGFFSRLFGGTVSACALAIVMGSESVDEVEAELDAAKQAMMAWAAKFEHKDFVMVTAFAPESVCEAIDQGMTKLCRVDAELAPLLSGLPVELHFNGKTKKHI